MVAATSKQQSIDERPILSLVIPAYQEEALIGSTLETVRSYLARRRILSATEVIVVSADGIDATHAIVKKHAKHFPNFHLVTPGPKAGKGRDVQAGFAQASGQFQVFFDADLATPLDYLEPLLNELQEGADVAIGVRDVIHAHESFMRKSSSFLSNLAVQVLAVRGIKDTQCGFKGFTREAATILFSKQRIMGWGFDIELLAIARKFGMRIEQVHIHEWFDPKGDAGLVGESQIGAMTRTLVELFSIRRNLWSGVYREHSS